MHQIDLDAYFRRIGYEGGLTPDFETLCALHHAHTTTIVFENLENWNGRAPALDLPAIEEKLITRKRGGYCYEMNSLFAAVLRQLGYEVVLRMAWVQWMQPEGYRPSRNHLLLAVHIDDRWWMVDVGFGAMGQTIPLALDTEEPQETPHETRRLLFRDGIITHQVLLGSNQWENLYSFDSREPFPMDFEVSNWYIATHPESLFRKTVLATLPKEDHRIILAFGEFTRRFPDGSAEKRTITTDAELRSVLLDEFGLPSDEPEIAGASLAPSPVCC